MGAGRLLVLCLALAAAVAAGQRPSALSIGGLFTYESTIGRVARLAIELAVDDFNADTTVLAGTNLNLITQDQDTNCSGFHGTIEVDDDYYYKDTNHNGNIITSNNFSSLVQLMMIVTTRIQTTAETLSPPIISQAWFMCRFSVKRTL